MLLLIALGGWLYHRTQLADIAADHLRLQVTGPARLRSGMTNEYSGTTTSVAGNPIPAQVEFALYASDEVLLPAHNEKTDEEGHLTVTIPADLALDGEARLEISARHDGREEKVAARLAVEAVRYWEGLLKQRVSEAEALDGWLATAVSTLLGTREQRLEDAVGRVQEARVRLAAAKQAAQAARAEVEAAETRDREQQDRRAERVMQLELLADEIRGSSHPGAEALDEVELALEEAKLQLAPLS